MFGGEAVQTLRAQNNLAVDLTLLGQYREAKEILERVYRADLTTYRSASHPTVLLTLINLTCAMRLGGEYASAYIQAEDTYQSCEANFEELRPITMFAAADFAVAIRTMRGGHALGRVRELLSRHGEIFEDRSLDSLIARMALANALRAAGQIPEATELVERAIELYASLAGVGHPFTIASRGSLAALTRLSGDARTALATDTEVLDELTGRLGEDHPYTLGCAMGKASDLAAIDRLAEACEIGTAAETRLTATLGPGHPMTLACAINLGHDLIAQGDGQVGSAKRAAAIARLQQDFGADYFLARAGIEGQRLEADFDPSRV
jgi:tetratricopeptide (TPR) repeat protein